MQTPLISVITINLNNCNGLRKTLESLACQTWKNFESVIVDGGSSDDSVAIIREFQESKALRIGHWVSERDKGLYNAQNKGILFSKGEYLLFLNSGDHLLSHSTLANLKPETWNTDIVYGNILEIKGGRKKQTHIPERISADTLSMISLWHPASFIRRRLFDIVGMYREDLKICSDYYFFVKAILQHDVKLSHIPNVISVFYADGISSKPAYSELHKKERLAVQKELFSPAISAVLADMADVRKRMNSFKFALLALPRYFARKLLR